MEDYIELHVNDLDIADDIKDKEEIKMENNNTDDINTNEIKNPVPIPPFIPQDFLENIKVYDDIVYKSIFHFNDLKKMINVKELLENSKIIVLDMQFAMNPYPTTTTDIYHNMDEANYYMPLEICAGELNFTKNSEIIVKGYEHWRLYNSVPIQDMMASNVAPDNQHLYRHVCGISWSPNNIEMTKIYHSKKPIQYKHVEQFYEWIKALWKGYDYFIIRGTQKLGFLSSILQNDFTPEKILFYNKSFTMPSPVSILHDDYSIDNNCPLHIRVYRKNYPHNEVAVRCAKKNYSIMIYNLGILKKITDTL
ncbi:MAG: LbFV-ORF94-like protein [Cotesia congregata filamentous virus 2]